MSRVFWIPVVAIAVIAGLTFVNVLWRRHTTLRKQADQAAFDRAFASHGGSRAVFTGVDYELQARGLKSADALWRTRNRKAIAAARKSKDQTNVVSIESARARKAGR